MGPPKRAGDAGRNDSTGAGRSESRQSGAEGRAAVGPGLGLDRRRVAHQGAVGLGATRGPDPGGVQVDGADAAGGAGFVTYVGSVTGSGSQLSGSGAAGGGSATTGIPAVASVCSAAASTRVAAVAERVTTGSWTRSRRTISRQATSQATRMPTGMATQTQPKTPTAARTATIAISARMSVTTRRRRRAARAAAWRRTRGSIGRRAAAASWRALRRCLLASRFASLASRRFSLRSSRWEGGAGSSPATRGPRSG